MPPGQPLSRRLWSETHGGEQVLEKRKAKSFITTRRSADFPSKAVPGPPMCRVAAYSTQGTAGRSCSFPQVPVSQVPKREQEESQLETGTDEQGASGQAFCAPHRLGRPGGHGPEVWAQLQGARPCGPGPPAGILPTHPH